MGCRGWSYNDLEPWFERAEVRLAPGESRLDRIGIPISDLRSPNPLSHAFLEAAWGSGLGVNAGFGDGHLEGAGWFRVTQAGGRRVSAADGYLTRRVRRRPNLTLVANAVASRILIERGRATGIEYRGEHIAGARRGHGRVILAAGAIGSPHLLLLSGIGPASELEAHGVPVTRDLPAVGRHLADHLATGIGYACTRPVTLATAERARHFLHYFLKGRGPLTSNVAEAGAFVRLEPESAAPEIELIFAPTFFVDHGFGNPAGHGYTIAAVLQHPESRGDLSLRSPDPDAPPRIRANYLSAAADLTNLVAGLALARRVGEHPAFAGFRKAELLPGPTGDLDDHVRRRSQTLYHPVGTCRMGTGADSVVSDRLLVHGIDDLWVADASVMPAISTGHTHAPVVAIAERAADLVRATR
jgi:choline dehydrogenase